MIGTTFFTQLPVRFPRFDDLNFHRTWARTYENCTPSHKSGTMPEAPPAKEGSTSSLPLIVPFRTTVPTREPMPTANSMRMRAATCLVGRGLDEETRGQEADVKRSVSTFGAYVITDCFRDVCVFVVCCRRSKILRKPMPSTKEKRRQQQRARREKLFLAQRRHLTSCSFTWHELVSADGKLVSEGRRRAARQHKCGQLCFTLAQLEEACAEANTIKQP